MRSRDRAVRFASLAALLAACHDGVAPKPAPTIPLTVGSFVLTSIDDNALPYTVQVSKSYSCGVAKATLDLHPDTTFTWMNWCAESGGYAGSQPFVQVAIDSLAFPTFGYRPTNPPPWAYARRRGDSLTVFVQSSYPDYLPPHTWLFLKAPSP